jgi:hypothetical protein
VSTMSAAVHRLRPEEPASKYSPEERVRIMSEARVHSVQWKAEQQLRDAPPQPISEVKHDHLAEALARPLEDKLTRYQREGREAEERRRVEVERTERESRREQRQAQRATQSSWSDWIGTEIDRRLGAYAGEQRGLNDDLLKLFEKHNEGFERIADRFDSIKAENAALKAELATARNEHAVAFERLTARIAELERAATKTAVVTSAGLRKVASRITEIETSKVWKLAQDWWGS